VDWFLGVAESIGHVLKTLQVGKWNPRGRGEGGGGYYHAK